MNPSSDENEVWRLGPLPEPVSWAVGIFLVLLLLALMLQVVVELHRDWSKREEVPAGCSNPRRHPQMCRCIPAWWNQ